MIVEANTVFSMFDRRQFREKTFFLMFFKIANKNNKYKLLSISFDMIGYYHQNRALGPNPRELDS